MTDRELAATVLSRRVDSELAGRVADSFRKWNDSSPMKPDGPKQFWDALAGALGCEDTVSSTMLIESTIDRFIQYLPDDRQRRAREILADLVLPAGSVTDWISDFDDTNAIWLQHTGAVETVATGLSQGKIDQRHLYLDPESSSGWSKLVRAEGYPTYDHCKTALQALVDTSEWRKLLADVKPHTVVMLAGGGAPTKDLVLLRSLLSQPDVHHIDFFLVDISLYMLRDSALWIREHFEDIGHVNLRPIHHDVLKFGSKHQRVFHRHGKAAFAITGGTIGNLSEAVFFESLNRAAEDGDVLVISADTIDEMPDHDISDTLTRKYDHPDLRRFIRPVVRTVLSESGTGELVNHALDRIKVRLRPGIEAKATDVPGSWCVTVTLDVNGREVTLVTSTRYQSSQLVDYAARFGWQGVCQIVSPLNPHYKQFCFLRKRADSCGTVPFP